jgi:hypothetical protein
MEQVADAPPVFLCEELAEVMSWKAEFASENMLTRFALIAHPAFIGGG